MAPHRVSIGEGLPVHRQQGPWVPRPRAYIWLLTLAQAQGPQVLCCCRVIFSGCPAVAGPDSCQERLERGRKTRQTEDRERKRGGGGRDARLQAIL